MLRWRKGALLFFAMFGILPPVQAAATDPVRLPNFDRMRREAEQFEQNGQWAKACAHYDRLLSQDRNQPEIRERYQRCLRCAQLVRRYQDASYRVLLSNLSLEDSLKVYGEILNRPQTLYADRDKVELPLLFGQGVQELEFLLDNDIFRQEYLAQIQRDRVRSFQRELQTNWARRPIRRLEDAKTQARTLAETALEILGVRPGLVILEMCCGACAGLDEYTHFVTPAQFNELNASWKGDFAGVGLEVTLLNEDLAIAEIVPGTAAELNGLKAGDRIARIGTKSALGLSVEAATELLKGEVGTTVAVEVISPGDMKPRTVQLRRHYIHVPSLSEPRFLDQQMGVGYLQLVTFQESTLQELDEAILKLQEAGMRTLILDLRANQGGLFEVAVQVVERFVSSGIIVSTHGQVREYNNTYR